MHLLVDEAVLSTVFIKMQLEYKRVCETNLKQYSFSYEQNGNFYLNRCDGTELSSAVVVSMDDENLWKLDKFQSCFLYTKKYICICEESGTITIDTSHEAENCCFAYFEREEKCYTELDISNSLNDIVEYNAKELQLPRCDIYLLIPGKVVDEQNNEGWESVDSCSDELFSIFKENINYCVEIEYSSAFSKTLMRKCFGKVRLRLDATHMSDRIYTQDAIVCAVKHETGFCVLEVFVYNCSVGGNKLLNYYCGELLQYVFDDETVNTTGLLQRCGMIKYGQKRSMIFAYGDVSDTEIINALANEEFPMGKIGGEFERKLKHENIAQYDTARVYVSIVSMIEACKTITTSVEERISYHAIEIFFVELLLFQDAAIDKVYLDLRSDEILDSEEKINKVAEKYEQISFDMSQASAFANYEQFNFPTVRISARNVVKNFGIEYVFEKYEANKELLASMIQSNKRKIDARQEKIKNYFLFLLSAIATVGTIGQMIHSIMQDLTGGVQSYSAAFTVVFFSYCIYRFLVLIGKIKKKK